MADRPTASTSRAGRPRMRLTSAHLPSHIPMAPKAVKPRTKSVQKTQVKGKGTGKGENTKKKLSKAVAVVSSGSEDLEVDFPLHPPNQPHDIPAEQPQGPDPPADIPAKEPQEPDHPFDIPFEGPEEMQKPDHPLDIPVEGPGKPEGPQQPVDIPAGEPEPPQESNNSNPLPGQPPIPMTNNQLNWSHFKPDFSGKPKEDAEAHLLRTTDWMTTHNFSYDQKVRRFGLTLLGEARL